MTEQDYDELVAPELAKIAETVKGLGGSMVCRVEWQPGESGITQIGPMTSAGQWMTQYAAHSHGNFDAMAMNILRAGFDVSQSLVLSRYQTKPA